MVILQELKREHGGPKSLFCDCKPAIHISSNPVFHEKTKFVEFDCHFVRMTLSVVLSN